MSSVKMAQSHNSNEKWQSPISPGRSWYEHSCGDRPTYPSLNDETFCDVVIVGGGFCGLSAALHLAANGTKVVLLEQHRLGDGASGRNGGQMGSGQRAGVLELEESVGPERAKALWDLAEDAKKSLLDIQTVHGFDADFMPGQLDTLHRNRFEKHAREEIEVLNKRYGYSAISWMDKSEVSHAVGSNNYFGGAHDSGTGHIHPMKYVIGMGKAAKSAGAEIYEHSPVTSLERSAKGFHVQTAKGSVKAQRCFLALNGHHNDIRPELARSVMPIQSFIGATVPLTENNEVLPHYHAVADSRFVVRYFRKTKDNRLLFGGREAYGKSTPGDIERTIRKQIAEIYPQLAKVELTHAWGGNVAITMPRMPYVRELEQGLWAAGGFSGHGVMMSNYTGRLLAEHLLGKSDQLRLLKELDIKPFPGGTAFRHPLKVLALTWYAMLDRL